MGVDLEEIQRLFEDTKELAVLINNNGVAKSKSELNFHDGRCECRGIRTGDGFQGAKGAHTTARHQIYI